MKAIKYEAPFSFRALNRGFVIEDANKEEIGKVSDIETVLFLVSKLNEEKQRQDEQRG
jgi:hypothetical protein